MKRVHDNDAWTNQDELQFGQLQERRTRVLERRQTALDHAIGRALGHLSDAERKQAAGALILHAEAIRDALEPYDSGIRSASRESDDGSASEQVMRAAGYTGMAGR